MYQVFVIDNQWHTDVLPINIDFLYKDIFESGDKKIAELSVWQESDQNKHLIFSKECFHFNQPLRIWILYQMKFADIFQH